MAANSEGFPSKEMSTSPPSTFQLQMSAIRNSAPFKTKSADVFSSLDTMERDYNSTVSKREEDVGGVKADDEGEAEEGYIKRGCIFSKPQSILHVGPKGSTVKTVSQAAPSSDVSGDDKASNPCLTSDKLLSVKHGTPSASAPARLDSSADSTDIHAFFRKPDHGACRSGGRRGRGASHPSRRYRPADHVLNPQKYTKYSLEETNMCGNSANRSVAVGFLSELKKRREQDDDQLIQDSHPNNQLVFQIPRGTRALEQAEPPTKKSYGSIYKMAEYEVGKASAPPSKRPRISSLQETPGMIMTDELTKPCAHPVVSLDHFENQQTMDKMDDTAHSVDQSALTCSSSSTCTRSTSSSLVDSEKSKQNITTEYEGGTFKSKKGNRKRNFRGRQEDA